MDHLCKCHGPHDRGFFVDAASKYGKEWAFTSSKNLLVCNQCKKPMCVKQDTVVKMRGPKNTLGARNAIGHKNGQHFVDWSMPSGEKVTTVEYRTYNMKIEPASDEPLIFQTWNLLMSRVEIILREPNGAGDNAIEAQAREQAKYEARGMAEVLAILMAPFVTKGDDVVRHAVKRYKDPDHIVPGLGEHLWDPLRNPDGSLKHFPNAPAEKPRAVAKKTSPPKVSRNKLTPEQITGIKSALDSGMFKKEEIATMFKVSLADLDGAVNA